MFERRHESGGLFWPFIFNCIMAYLVIFGLFMAAVFLTWQVPTQVSPYWPPIMASAEPLLPPPLNSCRATMSTDAALTPQDAVGSQAGITLISFPLIVYYFQRHCHDRFGSTAKYLPLEMAKKAPPAKVKPEKFTAPALRNGAEGWYHESQKVWEGYGMPSVTL